MRENSTLQESLQGGEKMVIKAQNEAGAVNLIFDCICHVISSLQVFLQISMTEYWLCIVLQYLR